MIKQAVKVLTGLIDSTSIRIKLMITFFILIVLPLTLFTFAAYRMFSNELYHHTLKLATQVFNEAASQLEKDFDDMLNVLDIITFDRSIYDIVSRDPESTDALQRLRDFKKISDTVKYLMRNREISNVSFYIGDKLYYSVQGKNFLEEEKLPESTWYKLLKNSSGNRLWCPPSYFDNAADQNTRVFSYAASIYNPGKLAEPLAVIRVDISEERINDIIKNASVTKNNTVYITNGKDIFISINNENSIAEKINIRMGQELESLNWDVSEIGKEKYVINSAMIQSTKWYLVSAIPVKDIIASGNKLKNGMFVFMFFITLVSYLLAYLISNSSVKRLSLLASSMKEIEKGRFEVSVKKKGNDEIGALMEAFNKMASRISELIEEKYKMGQEVKSAELKALQAQINPHFLYNSLDLINCIAIKHNVPSIVTMVNSLARFYKISLSRGVDVIPIKDEISHITLYVQIQNMRFDNKIQLNLQIDEAVYSYKILKILLQPIIENSIVHGILEKKEKCGIITVTGKLENNTVIFTIEDNGIGMTEEKIRSILSENSTGYSGNYGVKNINDRIKLYYGNDYGLKYTSEPGKGTTVEVRIPAHI
mgnify:CR=1 FL=1